MTLVDQLCAYNVISRVATKSTVQWDALKILLINQNQIVKNIQVFHRKTGKTKQRNKKTEQTKTKNKMLDLTPNIAIIICNVNF